MPRTPARQHGFTLIEVLGVIAILLLLIGLLFAGFKVVGGSSRERATRTTLQSLQSMFAELEKSDPALRNPAAGWLWWRNPAGSAQRAYVTSANGDFWRVPLRVTVLAQPVIDSLDAPGEINAGVDDASRSSARAILNSAVAMSRMAGVTNNRSALQGLPPERLFFPDFTGGSVPAPGADGFLGTADDGAEAVTIPAGAWLRSGGQLWHFVGPGTTTAAPPGAGWENTGTPAPLLLDAWNNPIIFVPGSGLRVRLLNGKARLDPSDLSQQFIITAPDGVVDHNGSSSAGARPVVRRAGRPFFASAGADGDFSRGDDNLYSFEP